MAKPEPTVDSYIAERSAPVQSILNELRELVMETLPDATEIFKWGAPVYVNSHGKEVVYLYGGKDHANLGFLHGVGLDDPDELLEGTGVSGRHVKVFPGKKPPQDRLKALIQQCVDLT